MIALFVTFILHRFASGIRNGAMYAEQKTLAKVFGFAIMPTIAGGLFYISTFFAGFPNAPHWFTRYGSAALIAFSVLCTLLCLVYMRPAKDGFANVVLRDLHLWTTGEQGALFLGVLIGCGFQSITPLLLAVYPSVFLQKCAINVGVGKGLFFNGTDDPKGKYYSIPALGLKVPRTGQVFRLIAALVSVAIFFTYQHLMQ